MKVGFLILKVIGLFQDGYPFGFGRLITYSSSLKVQIFEGKFKFGKPFGFCVKVSQGETQITDSSGQDGNFKFMVVGNTFGMYMASTGH